MSNLFPTYNKWPITVKEANGTTLIDDNGKRYLDFVAGIAVCNLGHCHPHVNQAIKNQLDKVLHVSNLFHIEGQDDVANQLVSNSSGDLVFFCNSGTEANEAAIKLVRKATNKKKIITFYQSFHGRTMGSLSATGQDKIHQGFGPLLEGFTYVPFNDCDALKAVVDHEAAAIILEVIQGEGGVHEVTSEFIETINMLKEKHKLLVVVDEVQTGIGRTGKAFGYQHYNLSPDIITVAKGLGNGFPVGGLIGKQHLIEAFGPGSHGSTFGGNPLAMAAATATTETIFTEEFLNEVLDKGNYIFSKLKNAIQSSIVKQVRGKGLMIGIECHQDVSSFISSLRDDGLLVLNAGPNVIRLLPPLTVSYKEIDQAVESIASVLNKVTVNSN
ncbi:acetylornithine transaminase [Anaerobacillus isosaccharinicus]|uniref:Acetylornithine aminotransferase n=1 Tax=Anaerobacillus isosaccharinicus TaxID=1532552 RepID=A0A1S2L7P8_9BACI|nr:acetylornithine transaminase [Anaerobacillus isosaccharinicus]MBA5587696.1 acetylornithine transaminase [Anaerobacillus isosaccharinicus]QOY34135.1 acetylornithine transaminase [Anaerobacillus isosaccharinicus]